jgi:RNA polymerase sigma factor (sigma-70 family)
MNGSHKERESPGPASVKFQSLLELIQAGEKSAHDELIQLLAKDFRVRTTGKRYFPISILREVSRQYLKHSMIGDAYKILFYACSADAILDLMASSMILDAARIGRVLRDMVAGLNGCEPRRSLLLRLHYIAGLNWTEIVALLKARNEIVDPDQVATELATELHARGLSEEVLSEQNLRPRGQVTQLLESVRDGERPLGDVVVNERAKLRHQAEHLLRLEGGNISLQADDLVNEMYLRLPRTPEKSPVNHMEFEALTKRIMRHILVDRARKPIPSQGKFSSELPQGLRTEPFIEKQLLQVEVLRVVNEVLGEMRETNRETAEMVQAALFGGHDQREIARLHSVSVSTVKRRIKDARNRIREHLGLE